MSTNGTASVGEEGSPLEDNSNSKRRRIAFSCLACRRRKLKCDRIYPSCSRCQKGGHPDACTYDSAAMELGLHQSSGDKPRGIGDPFSGEADLTKTIPRLPSVARSFAADEEAELPSRPPPENATSKLYAQEERIRQLENRIIGLENSIHGARPQWQGMAAGPNFMKYDVKKASDERDAAMKETMIFRGKSFKTQFYGASHYSSYLSHLPGLRLFMKDMILQNPRLAHVQRELKNTKVKGPGQDDTIPVSDSTLAKLLPQRKVADQLVRIYVDNFETTYRVLHLPSFWAEYNAFWNAPLDGRPAFVALLLLILAATNCLNGKDPGMFRGDSSAKREIAIMWIRNCDSWLQSQSQKHITLTMFQLHCLSFISKQVNSVKRKRTWTSAGTLARLAMSAGLHRNGHIVNLRHATPSSKKVSVFDQEMRRRIWATVSELELQAALERGMPAMMQGLDSDCGPPSNLEDEDFDHSVEQLPNTKPPSHFTGSSYQHLSRSSWSLRLELVSLINGPESQMPYEDVLLYDKKIMQHLDDIPHWTDPKGLVPRILLQLQLQQFLLVLHRPYARDESWGSRHDYSAIIHLRSAITMIDLQDQLIKTGSSFLSLFRNDLLGAALSICYNMSIPNPRPEHRLASRGSIVQLSGDPVHYLEKALSMIDEKIMCLGIRLQEYYCVSAVVGLARKTLASENTRNEERIASDRIVQMIQRVLAVQDNYSAATTLASLPNMPIAQDGSDGIAYGDGLGPPVPLDDPSQLEGFGKNIEWLDLTDIAGWDMDFFFDS